MKEETHVTDDRKEALVNELTSYVYAIIALTALASFMLLLHILLDVFFHT